MTYTYIRHIPSPPLGTYIDYFYYIDGVMPYPREKILPTGWLDLEVNLGSAIQIYDATGIKPVATCIQCWWVGVWNTYGTVKWPPYTQLMGIHFKPGGAYPFLNFPLSVLQNQIVAAEALWGGFAAELCERLSTAPSIQTRLLLFEELLRTRLHDAPHGLDAVRHGVAEIARHNGALSIKALGDQMGISHNHLLTQFKRMVGISPKAMARLCRLKHILHSIDPTQAVDWTQIAHQSNYYDQAHFNKDFRSFTGQNPTDYLRLRRQSHAINPERDRLVHVLPY
ncbi:MAG: helix-turn-helix domain-containing protein [Caldilineaceae bacterium]